MSLSFGHTCNADDPSDLAPVQRVGVCIALGNCQKLYRIRPKLRKLSHCSVAGKVSSRISSIEISTNTQHVQKSFRELTLDLVCSASIAN